MWKYKVHANGLGLLRYDGKAKFESWDGEKWIDDPYGFGTWSSRSSDSDHYSTIPDHKVPEILKKIDNYIKKKAVASKDTDQ